MLMYPAGYSELNARIAFNSQTARLPFPAIPANDRGGNKKPPEQGRETREDDEPMRRNGTDG